MKRLIVLLGLAISFNVTASEWLTDLPAAVKKAREENKALLLDFTGSDWCGWCKKLKSEVFDTPEFQSFADANLILVEVDFPRGKKLAAAQVEANQKLADRFNVDGFPTIILLDADEKYLGQTGYLAGGPKVFISQLEKMPNVKRNESAAPVAKAKDPFSPPQAAAYQPPPPPAKIEYGELALKAIMGGKTKRALLNNEALREGESGVVKVGDSKVKVLCKEIRESSVIVEVEGKPEPVELQLGKPKEAAAAAPAK